MTVIDGENEGMSGGLVSVRYLLITPKIAVSLRIIKRTKIIEESRRQPLVSIHV